MRVHLEPELERERLGRPVLVSAACHLALFALMTVWTLFIKEPPFQFGDPNGDAGAAVSVNVIQSIPVNAPRAEPNPVANPVEHVVPAPKETERPAAPEPVPTPESVPVEPPREAAPKRREPAKAQKSAPEKPQNQVPSTTGARASDPMFQARSSSAGGVGFQGRNPFGYGFTGYATALQRRLSEEWNKTLAQATPSDQPVVIQFRILRDGTIDRIRVVQSSGNRSFDYSAHKAVQYVNPFRPLPPGLRRDAINVEMRFQLN